MGLFHGIQLTRIDPNPFGSQCPSNPDTILSSPIRTLDHLPSLYAEQAELNSMQGPTLPLNHTQTQMMCNSDQQHSHLTSMKGSNMQINPVQLQTRGNSDFQTRSNNDFQPSDLSTLQFTTSQLQAGGEYINAAAISKQYLCICTVCVFPYFSGREYAVCLFVCLVFNDASTLVGHSCQTVLNKHDEDGKRKKI